jgi:lipopolysaccharide/colanic/teichoic acid biosynthesis glycosyltransferase/glycosyltransferase involved in cell wall biosynthesis
MTVTQLQLGNVPDELSAPGPHPTIGPADPARAVGAPIASARSATPGVSIVLSARNEERHIARALESIREQTFRDWECLVCDDGSTDSTRTIVTQFAADDPRFRLIAHDESAGLAPRLNELVRESKGALIARMDADDRMLPNRLARQVETFAELGPDEFDHLVLGASVNLMNSDGERIGERRAPTEVHVGVRNFPPVLHPTVMASREFFLRNPYSEAESFRRAEDSELWIRVEKSTTFRNVDEPLLDYRTIGTFEPARFIRSQRAMVRIGLHHRKFLLLLRGVLGVVAGNLALRNRKLLALAMRARRSIIGERLGQVVRLGMNAAVQRLGRLAMIVGLLSAFDVLSILHRTLRAPYAFQLHGPVIFLAFGIACTFLFGLPEGATTKRQALVMAFASSVCASLLCLLVMTVVPPFLPRFMLLASPFVSTPMLFLAWSYSNFSGRRDQRRARVFAIVGAVEADRLREDMAKFPEKSASLAGVFCLDDGTTADAAFVSARCREVNATILVISVQGQNSNEIMQSVSELHSDGVRVRSLVSFYEEWLGKLPVFEVAPVVLLADTSDGHRIFYGRVRRAIDIVAGGLGLALVALLLPFVFAANCLVGRGPLMFSQQRVGRNGVPFRLYKFRTMRTDASSADGVGEWSNVDDDRITRPGRVMRRLHVDEFPQFWNILRGDISLVGPRPEQPFYVERLLKVVPHYGQRHSIRPGLTGWAQVKWPYGSSVDDSIHKLQYDLFYLVNQSLTLDLRILARTARMTLLRGGR